MGTIDKLRSLFYSFYLFFFSKPEVPEQPEERWQDHIKVYWDNGHIAGTPNGSPYLEDGTRYLEWEFTYWLANRLIAECEKIGVESVMTMPDAPEKTYAVETKEDFEHRVGVANKDSTEKFKLFVSLHTNAASTTLGEWVNTPKAQGVECFAYGNSTKSLYFASIFQEELLKVLLTYDRTSGRGFKRGNFFVLRKTECNAVLLEIEFHTHREGVGRLKSPTFKEKITDGIMQSVERIGLFVVSKNSTLQTQRTFLSD